MGSIATPRYSRLRPYGNALWHNYQRNIWIFGKTSNFQIHENFQGDGSVPRVSCTFQVADLTENSPLPVQPQQNLSGTLVKGMGTAKTSGSTREGTSCNNFGISHRLSGRINSLTFVVNSITWVLSSAISPARGVVWHYAYVQKFIVCPLPNSSAFLGRESFFGEANTSKPRSEMVLRRHERIVLVDHILLASS